MIENLRSEEDIMKYWCDKNELVVSVCCITYNHEKYIDMALSGFLSQKTNFRFEILIHDDASRDRTGDIIQSYADKYPNLIRFIRQSENQYSKNPIMAPRFLWPLAKGKYIALCEGDDYWIDIEKLQRQVEVLEGNPKVSMVHTDVDHLVSLYSKFDRICKGINRNFYRHPPKGDMSGIVWDYNFGVYTCTMVFRSSIAQEMIESGVFNSGLRSGDYITYIFCAQRGTISYIDRRTSVYREAPGSVTNSRFSVPIFFILGLLRSSDFICQYFGLPEDQKGHYKNSIKKRLRTYLIRYGEFCQLRDALKYLRRKEIVLCYIAKLVRVERFYRVFFAAKQRFKKIYKYEALGR